MQTTTYTKASVNGATAEKVDHSAKSANDLSWSNVNFTVGDKKILTDCWGNVRCARQFPFFILFV